MTENEQKILQAAEEEFLRVGYDACSTAVIASKVGVTHAMVNYYYRTKEKLFLQILDNHVSDLLQSLKPLMTLGGQFVDVVTAAALALYDKLSANCRLVLLISDVARSHPEFLLRYKEAFDTICRDSVANHAERLRQYIADGTVAPCTMNDVYATVVTLVTTPFTLLPLLENVAAYTPEQVDAFLQSRREEMVRILQSRYSINV